MYEYAAQVVDVIDGDTVRLDVDLGFSIRQKMVLRLYGINTPELHGVKDPAPGRAAKDFLIGLLSNGGQGPAGGPISPNWKPVTIKTFKDGKDKYGRLLALIFTDADPIPVNDKLIAAGHAKAYFGEGPKPV